MKIFMNSLNDKLSWPFWVRSIFRENYLRLNQIWRLKNGSEDFQNLRCVSRNASLSLNEINYDKPVDGQIKLREKEFACVVSWSDRIDFLQKSTQKVAKKLKNCEDAAVKKQHKLTQNRLDECSMQQKRDLNMVSHNSWLNRRIAEWREFLVRRPRISWSRLWDSSGQSHVPKQRRITSSSRRKSSRDSGVPRNTRSEMNIWGRVFEDLAAQEHPKEFFENSKNLATSSSSMTRKDRMRICLEKELDQEPVTTIPIPCFQERARGKCHEGGNCPTLVTGVQKHAPVNLGLIHGVVCWIIRDIKYRKCILATSQTLRNSKAGKCSNAKDPRLTMQCTRQIETSKSIDDLITPRSIVGRSDFQIMMSWMRWWHLHWESFSIGILFSERM